VDSVYLRAFAKVNYALDVLGIREDGYHEVATVLQSISLADEVFIERAREGFELVVDPEEFDCGPPEKNTSFRAWRLLCEVVGEELPVGVRLAKRIPAGSGLGGASADAAAVLVGVNELYGLGMGSEKLQAIGARVGADVPFSVRGGTAMAEGFGERLTPLPAPPDHALLVVKPGSSAETAAIYRAHDVLGETHGPSAGAVVEALERQKLNALATAVGNGLTSAAASLIPEVEEYRQKLLKSGTLGVSMSGSGSAVYGIFASEGPEQEIHARFRGVFRPVESGVEMI
jgi:4-diphosphocytidyl-2-C-methyl-D-erythritol kinase